MDRFISYKLIAGIFATIFLSVTGFFASNTVTKLTEIQRDLLLIQLQITEIKAQTDQNFILVNSKILTKEDVIEIAKGEVSKHYIECHHK